ncbi:MULTISPECIES: thiolase family protein [Mycobacterium]|uniref:propanoyl-CoA C-acyltransferase n=1 Tax=Mycobacterium kiyosense TaxID=2871094 RepID=A0A9P3Q741_9MYCO|nr:MULTISPECIES: thiolase family protein [Mycobacterium]BDB44848.1 thiolase [Mycobacterium kiyosense]BDE16334.1 thiolase [Mycobacterium sp. 20KCMC460]GLB82810.1 thiolase [Mycobacterium kiyosense]GLB89451.1 thiolase [Mycobacterium kiyosense]GLB94949.1 thiolase [Mycobacterium kiyosense]
MRPAIWGVGTTSFGKQPGRSAGALVREAVHEAFADADVTEVDAVYAGTVFGAPGSTQRALQTTGVIDVPIVTVENACASGTTAFHEAAQAVSTGRYERVLALGFETMTTQFATAIVPEETDREGRTGLAMPGIYAMAASRYVAEFGVTPAQLAAVAVKNRRHGAANPRAQHGSVVTAQEVLASRMIADPLTLLQCCSISDAAAAAVIGPPRHDREVLLRGSALCSGGLWDHRCTRVWGWNLINRTAELAYQTAGIGPEDADLFEVHDAFTIGEIVTVEALGLAKLGDGAQLAVDGTSALGGRSPVNPSGGLLARGHPLGATGLAQVAEAVWQLRGRARNRQVDGARLAVVETMGGGAAGVDGNGCVVAVLEGVGPT